MATSPEVSHLVAILVQKHWLTKQEAARVRVGSAVSRQQVAMTPAPYPRRAPMVATLKQHLGGRFLANGRA